MDRLTHWVLRWPKTTLVIILLVTVAFAAGVPRLQIDNSIDSMLPVTHPARILYDKVNDTFGGTDIIVVALESDDVFSVSTLGQVIALTDKFEAIPGVDKVVSLSTVKRMQGSGGDLIVRDLIPVVPTNPQEREELRDYVMGNAVYIDNVISNDGRYAGFIIDLSPDADDSAAYGALREITNAQPNASDIYIAGGPAVSAEMSTAMKGDIVRLIPFVVLVLAMVLYLSLRTLQGVLLPLAVVIVSTIWTVGLMAWSGTAMAMISTTLPVMLIAIGVADAIHILTDYYSGVGLGKDKREAIRLVMRHIGLAVVLTSITTLVGFLSLGTSPVRQVMQFGLFVGFGVMAALVITLTLIPAVLELSKVPAGIMKRAARVQRRTKLALAPWLDWVARIVVVHRKAIVLVGIAVFLFAAVGATRLTVETNTLRFFRPESSIRQATEVVDKSFGGSENLSLIIDGDIKSPEVLNSMLALQSWAEELPQVGYTVSIADYVAQINQSLLDNDPSQHVIPATSNAVAQEILLYEMSGDPSDFSRVVNYNYDEARIAMRMESLSSSQLANLIDEVNSKAVNAANGGFGVKITGSSYLFKVLTDLLVHGQILSLLVSLLGVALVVGLIFRSVRFGLLSMIPLGFTITLNFGMMGWLGIPLDTATTMLASIAIGIGVDYTVHFLSKYRQQRREGVEPQNAVSETIRTTGRAIIYNAIAVAAGFAVLLFSSFGPIATLGGLVAVTMGISSLAALTLLPSALLLIKKKV